MDDQVFVIENPELLKALEEAPEKVIPFLFDAMTDVVFLVQSEVGYASYPPSTEANMPGRFDADGNPMGYYERGRGWWYPVLRTSTLGGKNSVGEGAQDIASAYRRHKIPAKNIPVSENVRLIPGKTRKANNMVVYQEVGFYTERENIVAGYKLAKNKNGNPGTSEVLGKSWTTNVQRGADFIAGEIGTPVSYADYVQGYQVPQLFIERGWVPMPERLEKLNPRVKEILDRAVDQYLERFGE